MENDGYSWLKTCNNLHIYRGSSVASLDVTHALFYSLGGFGCNFSVFTHRFTRTGPSHRSPSSATLGAARVTRRGHACGVVLIAPCVHFHFFIICILDAWQRSRMALSLFAVLLIHFLDIFCTYNEAPLCSISLHFLASTSSGDIKTGLSSRQTPIQHTRNKKKKRSVPVRQSAIRWQCGLCPLQRGC